MVYSLALKGSRSEPFPASFTGEWWDYVCEFAEEYEKDYYGASFGRVSVGSHLS